MDKQEVADQLLAVVIRERKELQDKVEALKEIINNKMDWQAQALKEQERADEYYELNAILIEALRYLSDDGWFDEESTSWKQERDSRIKFAASFLPPKENKS